MGIRCQGKVLICVRYEYICFDDSDVVKGRKREGNRGREKRGEERREEVCLFGSALGGRGEGEGREGDVCRVFMGILMGCESCR